MDIARFQLIERIVETDLPGGRITCSTRVPAESPLFEGHFPDYPLLPGTLQLETMAQAAGVLMWLHTGLKKMPLLAGVDRARFRRQVEPRTELTARATLVYVNPALAVCDCELEAAGHLASSSQVRLVLGDFPNAGLRAYAQRALARYLAPADGSPALESALS